MKRDGRATCKRVKLWRGGGKKAISNSERTADVASLWHSLPPHAQKRDRKAKGDPEVRLLAAVRTSPDPFEQCKVVQLVC